MIVINTSPGTASQISEIITWQKDMGKTGGKILSSFNKRIAVMKTLPHLKSMHIAGEIETLLKDNIIDYKAA